MPMRSPQEAGTPRVRSMRGVRMVTDRPFTALSLGAGQGSTALAIAIADRLVAPSGYDFGALRLDKVTFADTGSELSSTYLNIERLREYLRARGVEIDVVRRSGRPLFEQVMARTSGEITGGAPALPFFLAPDGKAMQQCTHDYKSRPLDRAVKIAAKAAGKLLDVQILIGFTIDEWKRMRGPRADWPKGWRFAYPMIDAKVDRGWAVEVCRRALGYVPVSSACAFCPHRPDVGPGGRSWIRDNDPAAWAKVVALDAACRKGYSGLRQDAYISKLRLPVTEALDVAQRQGEFWEDGSGGCDEGRCFT